MFEEKAHGDYRIANTVVGERGERGGERGEEGREKGRERGEIGEYNEVENWVKT